MCCAPPDARGLLRDPPRLLALDLDFRAAEAALRWGAGAAERADAAQRVVSQSAARKCRRRDSKFVDFGIILRYDCQPGQISSSNVSSREP